jgi:hypothetical protein
MVGKQSEAVVSELIIPHNCSPTTNRRTKMVQIVEYRPRPAWNKGKILGQKASSEVERDMGDSD